MLNKILDKVRIYPFLVLFMTVCILLLLLTFNIFISLEPKKIDLNDYKKDVEIILVITNLYTDQEFLYIEGYAYSKKSIEEYDNYNTGKGKSYNINNTLIIGFNNEFKSIITTPNILNEIFDDEMNNIGYTGFLSKVKKSKISKPFKIGVIVNEKDYKILDENFDYE